MKVFKNDFKVNLKSLLIWSLSASALAFLSVISYEAVMADSAKAWSEMVTTMPKAMLDAFNVQSDAFDTVLKFYAVKGYLYIILLVSIYASLLGSKLINKEESEQTTEFILTKPISRINYITQKIVTLVTSVTLANIIVTIILYLGIALGSKDTVDMNDFLLYQLASYLISLTFGFIAFMIACLVKRVRGLTGISVGIVFLSFFLGILSNISDKFTNLQYLSLFQYFEPNDLLDKGLNMTSVVFVIGLMVLSIMVSYRSYLIKDI